MGKDVDLGPEEVELRWYEPHKVKGLHRSLAALTTAEGFANFAEQNGFLGKNVWLTQFGGKLRYGEALQEWQDECGKLRFLVGLWDKLRDPNTNDDELFQDLEIENDNVGVKHSSYPCEPSAWYVAGAFKFVAIPEALCEMSLARQATRAFLRMAVSHELGLGTKPLISLAPAGQISLIPTTLLAAVYLHFSQELMGKSDPLIRCASCGKWFTCRHDGKMYCGQACKAKAFRRRQKKEKTLNG
ncbi:MAG: hypothetical protein ACOYON_15225 [Fimbriimonas sp.]